MRYLLFITVAFLLSCSNNDAPDVSGIKADLAVKRFEQSLFRADTNSILQVMPAMEKEYPGFARNFFSEILNMDPGWSAEEAALYLNGFISAYRSVHDSAINVFKDFTPYEKDIEEAVKYVKHYFPDYKTPQKIITYVGPLDGYGDILDRDAFIIGLHHHLGENFSLYKTDMVAAVYPEYITRRFEPGYIVVNCMKNVVNDMYPDNNSDKSLVIQMVESGKRLFLLQKFLPRVKEHMLIGYTEKQLKESYAHEAVIWDLFARNNYLQSTDINLVKNYIGESPRTLELGESSPGNIGSFAGWQIVKKYMNNNKEMSLADLMIKDPSEIFAAAKYKP